MKTISYYCISLLLLSGCSKELSYTNESTTLIAKENIYQPTIDLADFKEMLNENYQYRMIKYYSEVKDLWSAVPEWVKDDAYTFRETGDGWIDTNTDQDPDHEIYGWEQSWKISSDKSGIHLEWVDIHYNPVLYTLESYTSNQSFVVSSVVDKIKIFTEYRIWE